MRTVKVPPVACAKCDKIVDRLEWGNNPADGSIVFEAHCHGEVDRCSVPVRVFHDPSARIVGARAFEPKKESISHAS